MLGLVATAPVFRVAAYARRVVAHANTPPATPVIGTLHEGQLHADLKRVDALPGDRFEQPVDGFVIDVVRDGLLIEIQTGAFSPMRKKLEQLLGRHRVRVVAPVACARTVVRLSRDGGMLGRRTSPKKGRVEDVFERLTGIAPVLGHERLELELVVTRETELRAHEHGRVWRRKGWVIQGRALENVFERRMLRGAADLAALLPAHLDAPFAPPTSRSAPRCRARARSRCSTASRTRAPTHPGEILLEEFLVPYGRSQAELARDLKKTPTAINEIVKGKRGITAEMALHLAGAFGTTAEFWLNLQMAWDLWHARSSMKRARVR